MGKIIVKGKNVVLKGTKALKDAVLEKECEWSKGLDKKLDAAIYRTNSKMSDLDAKNVARKNEKARKKAAKKAEREERDRMFEEAYNRTYKARHSSGKHSYVPTKNYEEDDLSIDEKYFSNTDNQWHEGILLGDRKILDSNLEEVKLPSSGEAMIEHDLEKEPWYVRNGKSFIAIERIERVFIQYDADDNVDDDVVYIMFFTEQNENFIVEKKIHF